MPLVSIEPSLDTWVDEANPAATHATDATLECGTGQLANENRYTLIKWDLTAALPAGAIIVDCWLRFWWSTVAGDDDTWFQIIRNTGDFNAATDWTTKPVLSGTAVTAFRENDPGLVSDAPHVLNYEGIRDIAKRRHPWASAENASAVALLTLVRNWWDATWNSFGVTIKCNTVTSTNDTFWIMHSDDAAQARHRPVLVVEYATADALASTYEADPGGFYGSAKKALQRGIVKRPAINLWVETDDEDVNLAKKLRGVSGLRRDMPFLLEEFRLWPASFLIENIDGEYSETNDGSIFWDNQLQGKSVQFEVEVEGQTKSLYKGHIWKVKDRPDNKVELLVKPWLDKYMSYALMTPRATDAFGLDNLRGAPPDELAPAYIAEHIYEAVHNYAGIADDDLNMDRLQEVHNRHIAYGISGNAVWERSALAGELAAMSRSGMCPPYIDAQNRLAFHIWRPEDPTSIDTLTDVDFMWEDQYDRIINDLIVDWNWDYPSEIGGEGANRYATLTRYGPGTNFPTIYGARIEGSGGRTVSINDPDSIAANGSYQETIIHPFARMPGQAAMVARLYLQAFAWPFKTGIIKGGAELLPYDLDSVLTIQNKERGVDVKVRVIGYDPRPGFGNQPWKITMRVIPTNWPFPNADYVNDLSWVTGSPVATGTNTLAAPAPASLAFTTLKNGQSRCFITWTYTPNELIPDGFLILVNNGAGAVQAVPTLAAHSISAYRPD
ncbi:MAG: DNRLRE domain-containing protein, partial [Planctomycetota bacterium]